MKVIYQYMYTEQRWNKIHTRHKISLDDRKCPNKRNDDGEIEKRGILL